MAITRIIQDITYLTDGVNNVLRRNLTTSVPIAAKIIGVGNDAAYQAVRAGTIDSIQAGKRKIRVPVVSLEKLTCVEPGGLDDLIDSLKVI